MGEGKGCNSVWAANTFTPSTTTCFSKLKTFCETQPRLFSLGISYSPLAPRQTPISTTRVGKQSPGHGLLHKGAWTLKSISPQSHLGGDDALGLHTRQPDLAAKPKMEMFKLN